MNPDRWLRLISLLMLASLLTACAGEPPRKTIPFRTLSVTDQGRPATEKGMALRTGQIVVGESGGAMSMLFALFMEDFSPYVHSGILVYEDGAPIVYEARGLVRLETGEVPTDSIEGRITRRHLSQFIQRQNYVAIYDPPEDVDRQAMAGYVRAQFAAELPFDPYFNTRDRSQVYCTEFVALALEAGGAQPPRLSPMRNNASLSVVRDWLKIGPGPVILAESMLQPRQHVATVSRRLRPNQLQLYRAAKWEIHRRFTPDQKLGNLFSWNGLALNFRPAVRQFFDRAMALAPTDRLIDDTEAVTAVRDLAHSMFGPYPG